MKLKKLVLRTLIIIAVGLLFSFSGYGDAGGSTRSTNKKGDLLIEYDFLKGELDNKVCMVWFRKNITFKVSNVNPFLFKTTIDGKEFNYFTDAPKAFQDISKEAMGSEKKINDALNAITDDIEAKKAIKNDKRTTKKANIKIDAEIEDIMKIDRELKAENAILKDFFNAYKKLVKIPEFYNTLRQILLGNKTFKVLNDEITQLVELQIGKDVKLNIVVPQFISLIGDANNKYEEINFKSLEENSKTYYELNGVLDQLKACKKNIEKIESEKVIDGISGLINKFTPENFERSVIIPTVESDEVQFGVKIEPLNKSNTDVNREIVGNIRVRVKRGWTINFSTGAIFQFNAHDKIYRLDKMENDPNKVVIQENRNKKSITPSIAAFMHVYPRSIHSVKWGGITFGIGAKDTDQLSYYLGTSYMFGFMQRFIINCGVALNKIDTLKPEYQIGQAIDVAEKLKPENLVYKDYKLRLFVGITYNLTIK